MRVVSLTFCWVALLLMITASAGGEVISSIVAVVNDEVITSYEVEREITQMQQEATRNVPLAPPKGREELRGKALDRLVDKRLVEQKVRELNIKVTEEELRQAIEDVKKQNNLSQEKLVAALAGQGLSYDQYRQQVREQLERLHLMSQEVRAKIQVTEREVKEYYQANLSAFAEEDQYRARHIFFKVKKDITAAELKEIMTRASMVIQEATSGKDFAELARTYSDEPTAVKDGGDLGAFKRGDIVPEIQKAVTSLKPGEVSELIPTSAGYHIIKLEEIVAARVKPYEQVRGEIEETLFRKKSEERFVKWTTDLRAGAAIDIREQTTASSIQGPAQQAVPSNPASEGKPLPAP